MYAETETRHYTYRMPEQSIECAIIRIIGEEVQNTIMSLAYIHCLGLGILYKTEFQTLLDSLVTHLYTDIDIGQNSTT